MTSNNPTKGGAASDLPNDKGKSESERKCTKCDTVFAEEYDKILECEVCFDHVCAKCLALKDQAYKTTQRQDLLFFCLNLILDQTVVLY